MSKQDRVIEDDVILQHRIIEADIIDGYGAGESIIIVDDVLLRGTSAHLDQRAALLDGIADGGIIIIDDIVLQHSIIDADIIDG